MPVRIVLLIFLRRHKWELAVGQGCYSHKVAYFVIVLGASCDPPAKGSST